MMRLALVCCSMGFTLEGVIKVAVHSFVPVCDGGALVGLLT